jgi:pimeloyl-ACP methyl ester carboxylesterase
MRILALILAGCAASTLNWAAPAHPAPRERISSPEVRLPHISIQAVGKGSPVVLIPGLSTSREVWDGIVPGLARDHRVILVQVNGFGGDSPGANLKPGILDGIGADLQDYLATKKLGPVRLIGHSMGGLAALKFAKAHPEQVQRVLVVDSPPFFAVLMDSKATVDAVRPMAEMMRTKVASTYGKPADPAAVEANVKALALKPESIAKMKLWAAVADPRVTAQAPYEDLTTDIRPELVSIETPVTVIVPWSRTGFGEERTLAFYKRQYSSLPNATFVGVAEAGHFVMLDQPELFGAAVANFVK